MSWRTNMLSPLIRWGVIRANRVRVGGPPTGLGFMALFRVIATDQMNQGGFPCDFYDGSFDGVPLSNGVLRCG